MATKKVARVQVTSRQPEVGDRASRKARCAAAAAAGRIEPAALIAPDVAKLLLNEARRLFHEELAKLDLAPTQRNLSASPPLVGVAEANVRALNRFVAWLRYSSERSRVNAWGTHCRPDGGLS
jgi:hypothetical protein